MVHQEDSKDHQEDSKDSSGGFKDYCTECYQEVDIVYKVLSKEGDMLDYHLCLECANKYAAVVGGKVFEDI